MTQTQQTAPPPTPGRSKAMTAGIVADGAFKAALGAAFLIGASWWAELLGVPAWLLLAAAAALLIGGTAEIALARRRPLRTSLRLMIAYDSGWTLTALAGLLLARQGGGAAGELWIGYQAVAPLVFAVVLGAAGRGK